MEIKGKILGLLLLTTLPQKAWAQNQMDSVTAAFIYQFTKYIDWPEQADPGSTFTINVVSQDKLSTALQKLLNQRKIKNRDVRIIQDAQDMKADLFILEDSPERPADKIISRLQECKCLIVGLTAKRIGADINLYVKDESMAFDISQFDAKKKGFYINSRLLNLANRVNVGE